VQPEVSSPHNRTCHCPVTQAKPERAQNCNRRTTRRQTLRRALQTKPVKLKRVQHNSRTLFRRLTPELSRPVAGRRLRASVAQSTQATPRCGVGLNELLDLCLFSTRRELPFPKQALRTHDMQDEDLMPVITIEDAAGRIHNLTITGSF
jgi:hypothetical protein